MKTNVYIEHGQTVIETIENGVFKQIKLSREDLYRVAVEALELNNFPIYGWLKKWSSDGQPDDLNMMGAEK